MSCETVCVTMVDHLTGDEIDRIEWPQVAVIPRAGEVVVWWRDDFPAPKGTPTPVRKFLVKLVLHDWRFMPQNQYRNHAQTVVVVMLRVKEFYSDTELLCAVNEEPSTGEPNP